MVVMLTTYRETMTYINYPKSLPFCLCSVEVQRQIEMAPVREYLRQDGLWDVTNSDVFKGEVYRVKVKDLPKKLPLTANDIALGRDIIKLKDDDYPRSAILDMSYKFVETTRLQLCFVDLMDRYEISRDYGKTWEPCFKYENEN